MPVSLSAVALLAALAANQPPPLKIPITRDTWFSGVGDEADGNNGGAPRLKVKSYQETSLLDFDPAPLRGRAVARATLHLRCASPDAPLRRVTVGTFAGEWVEGTSSGYAPQPGASSYNRRRHPAEPWAGPGSKLTSVMLGTGGTVWRMADATPPDAAGWQRVPVDPLVVMARAVGVSSGLLIFDDTGTEWERNGERFQLKPFPNRFVHSRESGQDSAPYLTVELGAADTTPPAAPTAAAGDGFDGPRRPPVGETLDLFWTTPADAGAGVVGFTVEVGGRPVPRHLIPAAGEPGRPVRLRLRSGDVDVKPPTVAVVVRAVDGAGNLGPPLEIKREFAGWGKPFAWKAESPKVPADPSPVPTIGGADVYVLDPLDKVHPATGKMIPPQPAGYKTANHLWSDGTVRLHAARNEFVGVQLLFHGTVDGLTAAFEPQGAAGMTAEFFRYAHVSTAAGPLPDPLVPLTGAFSVPTRGDGIANLKYGSLLAEVYVGHDAPAGTHKATLKFRAGGQTLDLPLELTVWNFALPDRLSFLPEMNCYGLPDNEVDYYRLAHRHRTVLNKVPYNQRGEVAAGCAPRWDGTRWDWRAWDARFGPLLDGSAFADLPRKGVPLEAFYLPLNESWPAPMQGNYRGGYWADAAFNPGYREAFVDASREFAAHLSARGWGDTLFHGFLNDKVDFKKPGWSRGSSVWLLDEPAHWQDFWALKWYGEAFHEGVRKAGPGKARMLFRADISRPEWQRDALDAVLDYNVVAGGPFLEYHRLVTDRRDRLGQVVVVYGGTNAVEESNLQPVGWSLDAWSLGADGVLPWQTVGNAGSWKKADELALFYPGGPAGQRGPIPSIRLKAYLRGQQDAEYLSLLQATTGVPRQTLGEAVRRALKLQPVWQATGFAGGEDAGVIGYAALRPQDAWTLRMRVAAELAGRPVKAPQPVTAAPVPTRPFTTASPGYVSTEPRPAGAAPGATAKLQGPGAVRDVVIDPEQPDANLSGVGRDNRLRKGDTNSAYLVHFDLGRLTRPAGATVERATLTFSVWDPSSRGKVKVAAVPLKTAWDERAATWRRPAGGSSAWAGAGGFDPASDGGPASPPVVVLPDAGGDVADPPIEYQVDVTAAVRDWLAGRPNHGVALVPAPDRAVDDGEYVRFQLHSTRSRPEYGPRLTVTWGR